MTPARAALVVLMDGYIRVLPDPYITLLEVHKLMYFMQVAGESLKLRFVKGRYGSYAENLRTLDPRPGTASELRPLDAADRGLGPAQTSLHQNASCGLPQRGCTRPAGRSL